MQRLPVERPTFFLEILHHRPVGEMGIELVPSERTLLALEPDRKAFDRRNPELQRVVTCQRRGNIHHRIAGDQLALREGGARKIGKLSERECAKPE